MLTRLARVARMGGPEVRFRLRSLAQSTRDRVQVRLRGSAWHRTDLVGRLASSGPLAPAVNDAATALRAHQWMKAHRALAARLLDRPGPFVIAPRDRAATIAAVRRTGPDVDRRTAQAADRLVSGHYDLLGYRDLEVGTPPDWHADPVHGTRSPRAFWSEVPFLDHRIGDHKVIWEINRHQHWVTLGRAWWLTGTSSYRATVVGELGDWLEQNPPLTGINWASMLELAFRCLSWTWAAHFMVDVTDRDSDDGSPWLVDLLLGLDRQLTHVEQNLSYYFSPNTHLLGEGLALYVCGYAFPELAASARRIATGRAILLAGLRDQVEPDGGHRERSAHYHRYTLDFYALALAIARLADDPAVWPLAEGVERLAAAARLLADSTGRLPHLGDDDGGQLMPLGSEAADQVASTLFLAAALTGKARLSPGSLTRGAVPEGAGWMLGRPPLSDLVDTLLQSSDSSVLTSAALPSTGYFVSRTSRGDHAVIDAGPHGYLNGGHAHADALACTLTVAGQPVLVDPGTASYTYDLHLRDRFRSTALHNTVVVDGRSQSEPRGPFHWGLVADAHATRWQTSSYFDFFQGRHDGYAPVEHRRSVLSLHDDLFIVADCIAGPGRHEAHAHWHFHPDWTVRLEDGIAIATSASGALDVAWSPARARLFRGDEPSGLGWYSPAYGCVEAATTLRLTVAETTPFWLCTVVGLDRTNRLVGIEAIAGRPVGAAASVSHAGFRIIRQQSTDTVVFAEREAGATVWQVDDLQSDARLLYCRRDADEVTRLIVVDAERVHVGGARPVVLASPQVVRALHIALNTPPQSGDRGVPRHLTARVSGTSLGVALKVDGQTLALAPERRAHIRAISAGVR